MDSNTRELLYLLSVELIIFYLFGFGFLMLRADSAGFGGIGYSAVLYTFLAAYVLDVAAWVVLGLKNQIETVVAIATGGVIFSTVAFLTLLLLCVMLWSTPLVCIDVSDAQSVVVAPEYQCFRKGDSVRQVGADVKFSFPSPERYDDYRELANASVADLFMKARVSEGDYVTKLGAIFFIPLLFLIYVLQNSFFSALSSARGVRAIGFVDLAGLFLRCALLVLGIVMDAADFFAAWNVHDGYLQMTPSLVFLLVSFLAEFAYLLPYDRLLAVAGLVTSVVYMLISFFVVLYYAYPRYVADLHAALRLGSLFQLSDVTAPIVDTRPSLIIVLFIFLLIVDNLFVLQASIKRYVGLFAAARAPTPKTVTVDVIDAKPTEQAEASSPSTPKETDQGGVVVAPGSQAAIDFRAIAKKQI